MPSKWVFVLNTLNLLQQNDVIRFISVSQMTTIHQIELSVIYPEKILKYDLQNFQQLPGHSFSSSSLQIHERIIYVFEN